jgi:hypothetical protein
MEISAAEINQLTNQLIAAVAQKTGLTEAQARSAILATFEILKEQLPASVAGDIDTFAKGGGDLDGALQWFLGLIGQK